MNKFSPEVLLGLARDKSAKGREALAVTISDLFLGNKKRLTDRERALMFDILHQLVRETEEKIRRVISEELANTTDVPRDLAIFLANDEIDVAFPILTQSTVLQEDDLIETILHRTQEHQMAIAIRHSISENVSHALVKTANGDVIHTLLENSSAKISQATMEYLVEESKRVNTFQEPILRREDLDPDLAKRMFMWVSAALRTHILENFNFSQTVVDNLLEKAALKGQAGVASAQTKNKSDELALVLMEEGAVTPRLLIEALNEGHVHLFVSLFLKLTGLRRTLITRMVLEPGGEGLAIACINAGIGKSDFSAIYELSGKVRGKSDQGLDQEIGAALTLFDQLDMETAKDVVRYWQRDGEYLKAVRDVERTINARA